MDSIPLTGDGNAGLRRRRLRRAAVRHEHRQLLLRRGPPLGRRPAGRTEVASFAGFGTGPGNVAADADVADLRELLHRRRDGVRPRQQQGRAGRGPGHPVPSNATVAVDSKGRVYGIETGPCSGGQPGKAHVLDATLAETGTIDAGRVPGRVGGGADSAGVRRRGGDRGCGVRFLPWPSSSPRRSCCRRCATVRRRRSCGSPPASTGCRAPSPKARSGPGAASARRSSS